MGSAKRDVTFPRYADCSRRNRRIAPIMRKLILAGFILSQPTLSSAEEQSFTDVSFRMKPICDRATGSSPVGFDRMVLRNIKVASSTSKFATVIWDGTTTLTVDAHLGKVTLRASFPPERGSVESIGEGRCVVR